MQGFVEVFCGEYKTIKVLNLVPGTRYTFKLKVWSKKDFLWVATHG